MSLLALRLAVLLSYTVHVLAATYSLDDNFVGTSFLSGFTHEAIPDPTNGRVYVPFT